MNKEYLEMNLNALSNMSKLDDVYKKIKNELINCIDNNRKIIFVGNGGSASDINHIVCDLITKKDSNNKTINAISFTSNMSVITAISNDYEADEIYSRQLDYYGNEEDVIIGITTSGKSNTVKKCLDKAKGMGLKTILITGENIIGGYDLEVNISANKTTVVQNMYMIFLHMLCNDIEEYYNENRN